MLTMKRYSLCTSKINAVNPFQSFGGGFDNYIQIIRQQ